MTARLSESHMGQSESHMARALNEAELAGQRGEVPVGAVLVTADGEILAAAGNRKIGRASCRERVCLAV